MLKRNLSLDFRFFKNEISLLTSTQNFSYFTKKQQRLLILGVYLSYRSLRRQSQKNYQRARKNDPYHSSASFIDIWFCHAGVRAIVNQSFNEEILFETPDSFFEANYTKTAITSPKKANSLFTRISKPVIVHLAKKEKGHFAPIHSFIVIGKNANKIVTWEKESVYMPFKVSDISTIHDYYPNFYWGIKEFPNPTS